MEQRGEAGVLNDDEFVEVRHDMSQEQAEQQFGAEFEQDDSGFSEVNHD